MTEEQGIERPVERPQEVLVEEIRQAANEEHGPPQRSAQMKDERNEQDRNPHRRRTTSQGVPAVTSARTLYR